MFLKNYNNIKLNTESAEELCKLLIKHFDTKANHNKKESLVFFWLSIGGAVLAPFFVTLGDGLANFLQLPNMTFIFSKVIPTVISITAAFSTAWLQLRKPQQLWALYRTAQRELENHLYKFQYKAGEYDNNKDHDKYLVENISQIALKTHHSWLPAIPAIDDINQQQTSINNT